MFIFHVAGVSSTVPDCLPGPSGVHMVQFAAINETGGGHSTNGSRNGTPSRPRKCPRRPETWKRTVAKCKRAKGEEYISPVTGNLMPARTTGTLCKCKKKCYELFSDGQKGDIIKEFNALADKQLQDAHLFGLITSSEVKRRRPRRIAEEARTRRAVYTYHVSISLDL